MNLLTQASSKILLAFKEPISLHFHLSQTGIVLFFLKQPVMFLCWEIVKVTSISNAAKNESFVRLPCTLM